MEPVSLGLSSHQKERVRLADDGADAEPPLRAPVVRSVFLQKEEVIHRFDRSSKAKLDRLRAAVLARRPIFKEIIVQHGAKSVRTYVREYVESQRKPVDAGRQEEFLAAFFAECCERLGAAVAKSATNQLRKYYGASTMDHCGPLYHPWSFNFNLIVADICHESPDPLLQNVITLSFSNVSLNNFSFPRGVSFNAENASGENAAHRLTFYPSKMSPYPVFNMRPYGKGEIEQMKASLNQKVQQGDVLVPEAAVMHGVIDEVFGSQQVFGSSTYAEQITKINYALWNRLYRRGKGKKVQFIYLEQESLVRRLLLKNHFPCNSKLSTWILDTAPVTSFMRHFDGVHDCFSCDSKKGTYLFWALPQGSKRRLSLWKDGDFLVSQDGTYRVALTEDALSQALTARELIPSTMLSLVLLSFYYGLHCFGGMGQVSYLPEMKEAYLRMMEEQGDSLSRDVCKELPTKSLGGEVTVAFLQTACGDLVPATALDFLLYQSPETIDAIGELAARTSLADSLDPTLPTEYPMLYIGDERELDLFSMTAGEITRVLQTGGKLQATLQMSGAPPARSAQDDVRTPQSSLPFAFPSFSAAPKLAYARAHAMPPPV